MDLEVLLWHGLNCRTLEKVLNMFLVCRKQGDATSKVLMGTVATQSASDEMFIL